MEQDDENPPPFWLRQVDQHQHQQRRVSSMFLNTGVLVIILMVTAVIFLAIVIPSVASLSRQLFNPGLVKRSWSSLNVLLVIFAIVCGFLSRKDDDNTPVNSPTKKDEYPEKMQYNNFGDLESVLRLRRNSSSYPDLRQESNWAINDNKWRFNDDTRVENLKLQRFDSQVSNSNQVEGTKDIEVAYESRTPPSPPPPPSTSYLWPSPPTPPPPPPSLPKRGHSSIPSKKKTIQTFETIGHGRYKWKNSTVRQPKPKKVAPPPPPPPSRPRSRPVQMGHYTENKDFFSSFYYQSKKGKHKRRSYENLENFAEPPNVTSSIYRSKSTPEFPPPPPQPPPPQPPPPPPPQFVFNHLFSKKTKHQKKVKPTKVNPSTPKKPINKILSFTTIDDDKSGGGDESPMRPIIPPPPPPPPFKMKPWRFVKQGDYVKIESNNNKSTTPCHNYSTSEDENSKPVPLFSPSPDVDIKAEDFIAKFRAKLNLEKSNSINLRHGIVPSRLRDYS